MKLLKSKQGKGLTQAVINTAMLVIVLLVVLFQIYAAVIPEAQAAGDLLNDSSRCTAVGCEVNVNGCVNSSGDNSSCTTLNVIPLASLFSSSGIVFVIIMAALLILVVRSFMKGSK